MKFLKLDKFVWRDILHSMIQQVTGSLVLYSLKIYFFFYKVSPELHNQNIIHIQLRRRMIL